jgi:cellulose synthase/poly-beta-1,6-N-acetylglucosamine synthase-like glycosyltransferase
MELILHWVLALIAIACVLPLALLVAETIGALCARPRVIAAVPTGTALRRLAVIVPAHNEEYGLPRTLTDIVEGLHPGDRCLVVADNCHDGTAQAARKFPVEVLERTNQEHRGKGFGLQHGIAHLRADPPDVVLIVDADCRVDPPSLHVLAEIAAAADRPIQGTYLLYPPSDSNVGSRVSAFAFLFKNHIRPLGLAQYGGACLLFGTGMAFPWKALADASLGTPESVEDMHLAVQLALDGKPALYIPTPCVSGLLPSGAPAVRAQRQRWEHGHVRTLLRYAPRLVWQGVRQQRLDLLLLGADLAVPPLSLLAVLVSGAAVVEVIAWLMTGIWLWFGVLACATIGATLAVLVAWRRFGRELLSFKDLALIPLYIAGKLPIYLTLIGRAQNTWNERPASSEPVERGQR